MENYFAWHKRMRKEYYRITGHTPPYRLGTGTLDLRDAIPPYWHGGSVTRFPPETRPYVVYSLIAHYPTGSGRELLYVGMTSRPDLRIQQHREHVNWSEEMRQAVARVEAAGKRWHMEILARGHGEAWARETEARFIRELRPPGNTEGDATPSGRG